MALKKAFFCNRKINKQFLFSWCSCKERIRCRYIWNNEIQSFQKGGTVKIFYNWSLSPFPLSANCDYWRWGSGGRQESINAICILALNIINDKVINYHHHFHHHYHHHYYHLYSGFLGAMVVVSHAGHHWLGQNHLPCSSVQVPLYLDNKSDTMIRTMIP